MFGNGPQIDLQTYILHIRFETLLDYETEADTSQKAALISAMRRIARDTEPHHGNPYRPTPRPETLVFGLHGHQSPKKRDPPNR